MQLEQLLQLFGLEEKEARVYLTFLHLGTSSVYEVAIKSELKRPTVYLIVEELSKKGLVTLTKEGNKTYYTPLPPKKLFKRWQNNVEKLGNQLPALEDLSSGSETKPFVQFFEGKGAVLDMYAEQLSSNHDEMRFFGSYSSVRERVGNITRPTPSHHGKNLEIREILDQTPGNKEYSYNSTTSQGFEVRFVRAGERLGPIDICIAGGMVYIVTAHRDIFGIKIQSSLIASTMKAMFEMSWQMAIKKRLSS